MRPRLLLQLVIARVDHFGRRLREPEILPRNVIAH